MSCHRVKVYFAIFLLIKLLLLNAASASEEESKCGCSASDLDQSDQVLFSKDYGVDGIKGPLNITLVPGVQSGAVISVVTKTSNRGQTNLMDNKDVILHVDARISTHGENHLMLSTYMRGIWRPDYRQLINPIASGAKVTTTIIYEPNGCRIFINGREIAFYDHRNFKKPTVLNLEHDLVYKVMYLTTVKI